MGYICEDHGHCTSTAAAVRDLGWVGWTGDGHRLIVCALWTQLQILRWPLAVA